MGIVVKDQKNTEYGIRSKDQEQRIRNMEYGIWNMEQWLIFKDQGALVHRSLSLVCDP